MNPDRFSSLLPSLPLSMLEKYARKIPITIKERWFFVIPSHESSLPAFRTIPNQSVYDTTHISALSTGLVMSVWWTLSKNSDNRSSTNTSSIFDSEQKAT